MKRLLSLVLSLLMLLTAAPAALAAGETLPGYADVPADAYYAGYLQTLTDLGAVSPADGGFSPDAPCTRAEFITWLWKLSGETGFSGEFSPEGRGATALTADDAAKLLTVTAEQTSGEYMDFAASVYRHLGIDLTPAYADTKTPLNVFVEIFDRVDEPSADHERDYVYAGEKDHPLDCMLIDGFWGPRTAAGGASWPVADGTESACGMDRLQPGDVLMLGDYEAGSARGYMTCVYLGESRFLVHQKYTKDIQGDRGFVPRGSLYFALDFSAGADAALGVTFDDLLAADFRTGNDWEFWYALRPAQGVCDIHDPSLDLSVRSSLTDVDPAAAYAPAVVWAEKAGVTTGKKDGTFGAGDTVTRAQMVTFLYRYAVYRAYDHVSQTADISGFADADALPGHARTAMPWAVAVGIVRGDGDGALAPDRPAARAHAAAFLGRLLEA